MSLENGESKTAQSNLLIVVNPNIKELFYGPVI